MARSVGAPKGDKKRADVLFSKIIRSKGACECCGSDAFLQCAHIISRRFANTRCDEDNAMCLCAKCHHHFTDHPVEWGTFVLTLLDPAEYDALKVRAHLQKKVVWSDVVMRLKVRARELELV